MSIRLRANLIYNGVPTGEFREVELPEFPDPEKLELQLENVRLRDEIVRLRDLIIKLQNEKVDSELKRKRRWYRFWK